MKGPLNKPQRSAIRKQRNIVVLGFSMVGKTATSLRFANDRFDEHYEPTYENSFCKLYTYKEQDLECIIKDTQGLNDQDIFRNEYGLGYHGYVLVYSITSKRSLNILQSINLKLLNLTGTDQVPRVLVGNKADLADQHLREVSTAEGRAVADKWGCPFVECSAKFNHNIDAVFEALLDEIDKDADPVLKYNKTNCCDSVTNWWVATKDAAGVNKTSRLKACVRVEVALTWMFGVLGIVVGIVTAAWTSKYTTVQKALDNSAEVSYILIGGGLLLSLLSVLGIFGVKYANKTLLQAYCTLLIAHATGSIVFWAVVFDPVPFFDHFSTEAFVIAAFTLFVEVSSILGTAFYQSTLLAHQKHPTRVYRRHPSYYSVYE